MFIEEKQNSSLVCKRKQSQQKSILLNSGKEIYEQINSTDSFIGFIKMFYVRQVVTLLLLSE